MTNWAPLVRMAAVLAIAANLAALAQFGTGRPWLFVVLVVVLLAAAASVAYPRLGAMVEIRQTLARAEEILKTDGRVPDRLIAFDRSSAVYAGMLAQRMGIAELLSLPRLVTAEGVDPKRTILIGSGLELDIGPSYLEESVILVFHLRTGSTLEAGLSKLSVNPENLPRILALYATDGGAARWPGVRVIKQVKPGQVPNETLPWLSGPYVHK